MKQTLSHIILGQKGGENRIQILHLLRERTYNVNQMAEILNLNYRTVKHHIDVLVEHGFVVPSREGGYGEVYFLTSMMDENWHAFEQVERKVRDIVASPKFFRALLEGTSDAVVIINGSGDVLFWNKSAEKLFGYTSSEIVGLTLPIFPEWDLLGKLVRRIIDGERISAFGSKGVHKNGTELEIEITIDVIEDDEGNVDAYSILARDRSERMRTARALEHMAAFSRLNPNPVIEVDSLGRIVLHNAATTEALTRLAPGADASAFLPSDMAEVLAHLGDDMPTILFRSVRIGAATFDLDVQVVPELYVVRIYAVDMTKRTKLENDIIMANDRLSLLLTWSPTITYSARPTADFTITYISDNVEHLTGRPPSDFIAVPRFWIEHIHPDDVVQVLPEASKTTKIEDRSYDYRFKRKDGRYIWVHDQSRLVRDRSGNPLEIVGFIEDVTLRKMAEDTIRINEERLRMAQSVGGIGTFVWDVVTNDVMFSKELEAVFGLPPGGLGNKFENWERMVHPDDRATIRTGVIADQSGPAHKPTEFRIVWPDGSVHWISTCGETMKGPKGEPQMIIGMSMDITERKMYEERLAASEERNRCLIETITVGIVFQDAEGLITSANPEAIRLLGLSLDQMQGQTPTDPIWKFINEDGSESPWSEHPAMVALGTGQSLRGVPMGVFNPEMKRYIWISIDAVPMFKPGNPRPSGVFTTFKEIPRPEGRA